MPAMSENTHDDLAVELLRAQLDDVSLARLAEWGMS